MLASLDFAEVIKFVQRRFGPFYVRAGNQNGKSSFIAELFAMLLRNGIAATQIIVTVGLTNTAL
jgi:hypothetical protein